MIAPRPTRSQRHATALQALFEALATGGRAPILDLLDWEEHLNDRASLHNTAVRRWYLAALRYEWQPPAPPTALCDLLTDDAHAYLETRPGPWATVWGHIMRVAGNAVWLAEQIEADVEAAYLAALFHDMHKLDEWDTGLPHAELGARRARRILSGELSYQSVSAILHAIAIHPARPAPSQTIARLLHDADKLDKIGATGLIRRLSKTNDLEEACEGAWRTLDEAEDFPSPCLPATSQLLAPKLVFAQTLETLIEEVCPSF